MGGPTVYVLGAGASAGAGGPLLKNFLPHVVCSYPADPRVGRVARFLQDFFGCDPRREDDQPEYDTVLSFLDLALQNDQALDARWHERELKQLRDDFIYLIWLSLRDTAVGTPDELHARFVADVLRPEDTVLSLNYDLLVDNAVYQRYYGIDYGIEFRERFVGVPCGEPALRGPRVLKLHGSLNWLHCPTCGCMFLYLGEPATARIFRGPGEHCPGDGSYLKGVLIPPTWVKSYRNPHLLRVWLLAEEALRAAGRVVFVGYSLASTDVQVLFSMRRALHNNPGKPVVEVVDPERRGTVRQRYRRLFGPVTYHQLTFERWLDQAGKDQPKA